MDKNRGVYNVFNVFFSAKALFRESSFRLHPFHWDVTLLATKSSQGVAE